MPKLYILSAFSLSMIPYRGWIHLYLSNISPEEARRIIDEAQLKGREVVSAVEHPGAAQLLTELIGRKIEANRIMVELHDGDEAIVLQLMARLPEGEALSREELQRLYSDGKIKLLHVILSTKFW